VREYRNLGRGSEQDRVPVGGRFRHDLRADDAARAGAIFNDHRLSETFRNLLRHEPRDEIGRASGWIGNDDAYGLRWKGLPGRGRGENAQQRACACCSHTSRAHRDCLHWSSILET
jgi:hypothetical protein